jgi:hypothetical protein
MISLKLFKVITNINFIISNQSFCDDASCVCLRMWSDRWKGEHNRDDEEVENPQNYALE